MEVQEGQNNDTDADYIYVHFTLPYSEPMPGGSFYISGALSDWDYSAINRMEYNFDNKSYQSVMLLKQGFYNYQYEYVKNGSQTGDLSYAEGNHYETENDYIIIVYYHPSSGRYDRIIGYQIANSLRKGTEE